MSFLNSALQALKRAWHRPMYRRGQVTLGRGMLATPCVEPLEDRTLLSVSPARLDGILAPGSGVLGDTTGIAVANAAYLSEAGPALFSYLGYQAQFTAEYELTVHAAGDIDLSGLRPDYLQSQGIRSLVIQVSDATDDTLHIDLSHGYIPLDLTFHGGDGGYATLVLTGVNGGNYTPGKVFGDGTIQAGQTRIEFTGLEPI